MYVYGCQTVGHSDFVACWVYNKVILCLSMMFGIVDVRVPIFFLLLYFIAVVIKKKQFALVLANIACVGKLISHWLSLLMHV